MGYFGIQVHDKNGSICINSLLCFPCGGRGWRKLGCFPAGQSWVLVFSGWTGGGKCRVPVLNPTASRCPNNGNGCFSREVTVFPAVLQRQALLGGDLDEGSGHHWLSSLAVYFVFFFISIDETRELKHKVAKPNQTPEYF